MESAKGDHVDTIIEQWARERPDLDASVIGVLGRVYRISRITERRYERAFFEFGLSRWGFEVLAALRRSGHPYALSPTALFNSLMVSSGAMTNRIDRLEEAGFVARSHDPRDRRGILVSLTPKGLEVIEAAFESLLDVERDLLVSFTEREKKQLSGLLRKVLLSAETPRESHLGSARATSSDEEAG